MTTSTRTATEQHESRHADLLGEVGRKLLLQFPARVRPDSWPATTGTREEILARIDTPAMRAAQSNTQAARRYGTRNLLRWLERFPGSTWQQRWLASPAQPLGVDWLSAVTTWLTEQGETPRPHALKSGLLCLSVADVIRPDLDFLITVAWSRHWHKALRAHRDPAGFARLDAARSAVSGAAGRHSNLPQIAVIMLAKGGTVTDITVGDCLEIRARQHALLKASGQGKARFYTLLKDIGVFPPDAPASLRSIRVFTGQRTVEQLVDRYDLQCRPVRDLLVDYLAERQSTLDHTSLEGLSRVLASSFWKDLETHHPGISSLNLTQDVATAWKKRVRTKTTRRRQPDGSTIEVTSPRVNCGSHLSWVRAFYLDIAQWALDDPARWGPWAVPCPISVNEANNKKHLSRRKARMDQRTRERLPLVPQLVQAAEQCLRDARTRLDAVRAAAAGASFTVLGETFVKAATETAGAGGSVVVTGPDGTKRHLGLDEHRAFWGWATIEFLRHTGVRIEEMLETSHHSITQYTVPSTGELIPLLQIAPSKNDQERLLVVSPELADVLSAIIHRIRGDSNAVPLVPFYDIQERLWSPPTPLLFQWYVNGEPRPVSGSLIRRAINEILTASGITDAIGQPLNYHPHDFRRIFATDAIINGMPPHIAQILLGHQDINTTMGYKAIYPAEAITGHRAFIARRRAVRPAEEYRTPTDEEWDEFLGHFERRKVALGDCGRAYGTGCQHEHSCVRCPLLLVDHTQKTRLTDIRDNLTARIEEALRHGWLGEADGLRVSLFHANSKLAQLEDRARRAATVNLGIPAYGHIAGRTATVPPQMSTGSQPRESQPTVSSAS